MLGLPADWRVVGLYNTDDSFPDWLSQAAPHIEAHRCDLTKERRVAALSRRIGKHFDACVFLAANGNPSRSTVLPVWDLQSNCITLLNFLAHFEIGKFIHISSGAVYDKCVGDVSPLTVMNPKLPYAISKLACEYYVQSHVSQYVILRLFGAYGPHEPSRKLYSKLVQRFHFEKQPSFRVRDDGRNYIDAMYVEDTTRGIVDVLESNKSNIIVDFCCGEPLTINELVQLAGCIFGFGEIEIDHRGISPEYIRFRASPREMCDLFNFRPRISLEDGLGKLAEWMQGMA